VACMKVLEALRKITKDLSEDNGFPAGIST
jgi:hypothetical protein